MAFPREKTFVPNKHLGLSIEKPDIPDFVRKVAIENDFPEKAEVHISVVVTKNAQTLWRAISREQIAQIENLFKSFAWEYELTGEYFLHERFYSRAILDENGDTDMEEHIRRTIVQKVLLPGLSLFYSKLNQLTGISLPVPIPHITLFALNGRGIGINSAEDFERFTKAKIKP
jgi:hypothetical protein